MLTANNDTILLENRGENVKIPLRCTCYMLTVVSVARDMFSVHHTNGTTRAFTAVVRLFRICVRQNGTTMMLGPNVPRALYAGTWCIVRVSYENTQ